jgi:hypothetical protein
VATTALVATDRKEKQMKDKILTLADRTLIRTTIVSAFVAAVVAVGTPAQAGLRRASADAAHRAVRVTTIRVSTHNARFVFSAKTAKRGVVIFKVTNPSPIVHYFSIKGRTTPLLHTGQSATLRVTFRRKGRYPYKDTFDHHAQFGEKGIFTIT